MRVTVGTALVLGALTLAAAGAPAAEPKVTVSHGLTLLETLKYGPDFKHLDYVNPDAPKGGTAKRFSIGTFDTFNPYIIKGNPAAGIGFVFETLMTSAPDEVSAEYGLIAKSIEVPDDLSYATFDLRPEARFHDGAPITADDVVYTFNVLKKEGRPFYRFYYANISRALKLSKHKVKFEFTGPPNRELPQIIGQIPVLSKAYWSKRDFSKTTLEPPLGSGPYRIREFEPGRHIIYERVKDWWGKDLPINKGRYNYDLIRYDFFRDEVVALEAFKAHRYDFRAENSSKDWATGYDFPAKRDGRVKTIERRHSRPTGMQGFIFNLRREKFRDPSVRQALAHGFDFEWSNRQLFYGQYARTTSYFENSELAARKLPDADELKFLEPLRGKIPDEVFTKIYQPPKTDGSGNIRGQLRAAQRLLKKSGWRIVNNRLVDAAGKPFEIEFLLVSPTFERAVTPFLRNLKRLGITGRIRTVDSAQYLNRLRDFDYDVIVSTFGQSRSPGNEQRSFWSSAAADRPGGRNFIGIKDKAIDRLVENIAAAPNRNSLITATRALDQVLLWNHFVIPQWHIRSFRLAWWNRFGQPEKKPPYGLGFFSWWIDPAKDAALTRKP